jgi:hypothetical protein
VLVCIDITWGDYPNDIRRGSEVSRSGVSPERDGSMFWLIWVQKCVPYAIEHPYEIQIDCIYHLCGIPVSYYVRECQPMTGGDGLTKVDTSIDTHKKHLKYIQCTS